MNRRSFLTRLGAAAVGAAALSIDPEQLLWVPGAKRIIDFGSTKQVLPATDIEVVSLARAVIEAQQDYNKRRSRELDLMDLGPRDITLTIGATSFKYQGDQLVSLHSEEDLKLLDLPFTPNPRRRYS